MDSYDIKQELSDLKIRKFENVGNTTTVTLNAETKEDTKKIAEMLPELYASMTAGFVKIQSQLVHQNPHFPTSIPEPWLAQLKEIFEQAVHPPDEVSCEGKSINFKKKYEKALEWIAEKGWKMTEETIYRILAELAIISSKGFLPPH